MFYLWISPFKQITWNFNSYSIFVCADINTNYVPFETLSLFISPLTKMMLYDWLNNVTLLRNLDVNGRQWITTSFCGFDKTKDIELKSKCPQQNKTLIRFGTDCQQKYIHTKIFRVQIVLRECGSFHIHYTGVVLVWMDPCRQQACTPSCEVKGVIQ